MPELPEVETVVRSLGCLQSLILRNVKIRRPDYLKRDVSLDPVVGLSVKAVRRKGKYILIDFHAAGALIFHLGMSGRILLDVPEVDVLPHCHARFEFGVRSFEFQDPRRFGFIDRVESREELDEYFSDMGPDPLQMSGEEFFSALKDTRAPIKSALMNQHRIAGVGNIYADESLFQARIKPFLRADSISKKRVCRLHEVLGKILNEAISMGGSSLRDYRRPDGKSGHFQTRHLVYGRDGLSCVICETNIRKGVIAGRGTHWCPRCQR